MNQRRPDRQRTTNIRQFRELYKYTQEYMAERMGISQNAYSKIENELSPVTVQHLLTIAGIFEIPVTQLFGNRLDFNQSMQMQIQSIHKEELEEMLARIQQKVKSKKAQINIFYPHLSNLLHVVDQSLDFIE